MNTHRTLFAAVAVAAFGVVTVVTACSDSSLPQSATAPIPEAAPGIASAARLMPQDRGVPAASRWVGEEHNRLVGLAMNEIDRARSADPVAYAAMRRDCNWLVNFVKREASPTLTRGGFTGPSTSAFSELEPTLLRSPECQAMGGRSFNLFVARPIAAHAGTGAMVAQQGSEEISPAAFALIDGALTGVRSARNRSELDAAIVGAATAAAKLSSSDAAAVNAVLSVAQGSATYWSTRKPKTAQFSLFARFEESDWDDFKNTVSADAGACSATLSFMKYFSSALPINAKIGLCALGAAVGSVAYFVD